MNTAEAIQLIRTLIDATSDYTDYTAGRNQRKSSAAREHKAMVKLFFALAGQKPTPEQAEQCLGW